MYGGRMKEMPAAVSAMVDSWDSDTVALTSVDVVSIAARLTPAAASAAAVDAVLRPGCDSSTTVMVPAAVSGTPYWDATRATAACADDVTGPPGVAGDVGNAWTAPSRAPSAPSSSGL